MAKGNGSTQNQETVGRTPSTCSDLDQVQCVTTNVTEHLEQLQESVAEIKTDVELVFNQFRQIQDEDRHLKEFISMKQKQHDQEINTLLTIILTLKNELNLLIAYLGEDAVQFMMTMNVGLPTSKADRMLEKLVKQGVISKEFKTKFHCGTARDLHIGNQPCPVYLYDTESSDVGSESSVRSLTPVDSDISVTSDIVYIPSDLKQDKAASTSKLNDCGCEQMPYADKLKPKVKQACRGKIIKGLLKTEFAYCKLLWYMIQDLPKEVRRLGVLSDKQLSLLFPECLKVIYRNHIAFYVCLKERILQCTRIDKFGDLVSKLFYPTKSDTLMTYHRYIMNLPAAHELLARVCAENTTFRKFVNNKIYNEEEQEIDIHGMIEAPLRRIETLVNTFKKLIVCTGRGDSDSTVLPTITRELEKLSKLPDYLHHPVPCKEDISLSFSSLDNQEYPAPRRHLNCRHVEHTVSRKDPTIVGGRINPPESHISLWGLPETGHNEWTSTDRKHVGSIRGSRRKLSKNNLVQRLKKKSSSWTYRASGYSATQFVQQAPPEDREVMIRTVEEEFFFDSVPSSFV